MILFVDKLILYLFSFIYLYYLGISAQTTALFLLSIAFTSLLNAYTYDKYKAVFLIILFSNLVLACFVPMYVLFLPIILYDCILQIPSYICLLFAIPVANIWVKQSLSAIATADFHTTVKIMQFLIFLFILQMIISYILAEKTNTILENKKESHRMQDTYQKIKLDLEHKNRHLLQQQNDEINIATLNERNRIAREIHDNVGHILSRSILQLGALIAINKEEALREPYDNLKASLNQAMDSIRNSVHDLHNESIDLEHSIKQLIESFDFCDITLDYDISKYIEKEIKYCFISITKEALNNTMKHSNATAVSISIIEHPSFYKYVYDDNGTGLHNDHATPIGISEEYSYREGIGLSNMRERVKALQGIINFQTEKGFSIHITIPKG